MFIKYKYTLKLLLLFSVYNICICLVVLKQLFTFRSASIYFIYYFNYCSFPKLAIN